MPDRGSAIRRSEVASRLHYKVFVAVVAVVTVGTLACVATQRARRHVTVATRSLPPHGMDIVDGRLEIRDWNKWMRDASIAVSVSMEEIGTEPVALATNVFRRLFPERPWPPPESSELEAQWNAVVRAIASALKRPMPARLEVVE